VKQLGICLKHFLFTRVVSSSGGKEQRGITVGFINAIKV